MTTTTTDNTRPTKVSTLPARRPGTHRPAKPWPAETPADPLDQAWDLLATSSELPATERGLLKILTEYRKVLHALATHVQTTRDGQQR